MKQYLWPIVASALAVLMVPLPAGAIVTSDSHGSHTLATFGTALNVSGTPWFPPGTPALNHRSVVKLLYTLPSGQDSFCSSALVDTPQGPATLTAAHCVTNSIGNINVTNLRATYRRTNGTNVTFTTSNVNNIRVHPNYDGVAQHGYDLALIFWDQTVGSNVQPRYQTYNGATLWALLDPVVKLGFGYHGHGSGTPAVALDNTKRWGINQYGWTALSAFGVPITSGWNNPETQLTMDFDNGNIANDLWSFYSLGGFKSLRLGFGSDEVIGAWGDSGGPNFLLDPSTNTWVILAVSSYVFRMNNNFGPPGNSDVNGTRDFSWGEFEGDALVTPTLINEILGVIPPKILGAPFGPTSPAPQGGEIEFRTLSEDSRPAAP